MKNRYIVVATNLGGWDWTGAFAPQSESFFKGGFQAACKAAEEAAQFHGQFDRGYTAVVCRYVRGEGWQAVCQF